MKELELCHWLLLEPNGKCRSVFARGGDVFENYKRVGAVASSPQFVFPLVFAVSTQNSFVPVGMHTETELEFCLHRDDRNQPGPAFPNMATLKVATLVSELSYAIAHWIEAVGGRFESLQLLEDKDGALKLIFDTQHDEEYSALRVVELTKAGIEMMAYARGLKIEDWGSR
jgi:hypothetical protein